MEKIESFNHSQESEELISGRKVQAEYVKSKVAQEYDIKITRNIVSSKGAQMIPRFTGCHSRTGADRRNASPLDLPPGIRDNFKEINKQVTDWLESSSDNSRHFVNDPVSALAKAGIKLSREDQKVIARNFSELKKNNIVSPGMNIKEYNVTANTKKKISTDEKPRTPFYDTKITKEKDCGCM